ncbi:alkaline phosphatase family protein [Paenibacillus xerothermodurans]|uniref:Alkaline phosphatase family protein n=1 Tax=Paenibacillus xerothermodurans TaxID=1977292 RepID=A0A2W1NSG2_PAEXE|nr:alkaline phosphatase family protein [Paenibacillus xerothermodurans]PZE21723.1 alkaline phosphatase family protein [Paenibacillus xerothermodurans]
MDFIIGLVWAIVALVLVLVGLIVFRRRRRPPGRDLARVKSSSGSTKKVILIVVDSLLANSLQDGIRQNRLPTFKYLIDHGQYYTGFVSSFPTMSVTIDSTLLTGTHPDRHHVPGLIWYCAEKQQLINYGTGPMEILHQGLNTVLLSSLVDLNQRQLSKNTPTIYEDLSQMGLTSGSINGMIYRGAAEHKMYFPAWLSGFTALPEKLTVKAPDFFAFGSFSNPLRGIVDLADGFTVRLGLNSKFSAATAEYLIRHNKLPDFLYIYLPDIDKPLHNNGPSDLTYVEQADGQLHNLLQAFGSPEQAKQQAIFVVMGDSGVAAIVSGPERAMIDLSAQLSGYKVLRTGEKVSDDTELVLAVNETMAYVYKLKARQSFREVADVIRQDDRIDLIAWQEKGWIHVLTAAPQLEMKYQRGGSLTDRYGQAWTIEGDPAALDITVMGDQLEYGNYPDGLERLRAALYSHAGDPMVVTAKPGHELTDRYSPKHYGGGAHGSLHRAETDLPLIVYGTERKPNTNRMVDLKSYLLSLITEQKTS